MSGKYETRLAELGVTLPDAPAPAANYVPYVIVGDMVYVSGCERSHQRKTRRKLHGRAGASGRKNLRDKPDRTTKIRMRW